MINVMWFRVLKTYEKPQGGFLAHGPRYAGTAGPADVGARVTTGRLAERARPAGSEGCSPRAH